MSVSGKDVADAGILADLAYSNDAYSDLSGTGWTPLDATALHPYDSSITVASFSNGVFSNGAAQGIVAIDQQDHTLAISFRGTQPNQVNDLYADLIGGLQSFNGYYQQFSDLIDAALGFASDAKNDVTHILVTGHSLGGAAAELFMNGHTGSNICGVTFGSPGEKTIVNLPNSDSRLLNLYHTGDPVHDIASANDKGIDIGVDRPFTDDYPNTILGLADYLLTGGQEHDIFLYEQDAIDLGRSTLWDTYTANKSSYRVEIGTVDNDSSLNGTVQNDFILGDWGNDTILGAGGNDLIDGGRGNDIINAGAGDDLIAGGDGNDTIIGGGGNDTAVFSASRASYSISKNADGTIQVFSLDEGIDTLSGIKFLQFSDRSTPYTVGELFPPDTVAPTLSSKSPADDSSGVPVNSNIVLSFDEAVAPGSGSIVIHNANETTFESIAITDSSQVTFSGSQVTINPTIDFAAGAGYYVTVGSGVILDRAGNAFGGIIPTAAFNFTTAPAAPIDTLPPQLIGKTPADDSVGVSTASNIVLTFSEDVVAGSGNIEIHKSDNSLFASIAANDMSQVSYAGNVVTIDPTATLAAGTGYYVLIPNGAIHDKAGNAFGGVTSPADLNFTTVAAPNTSSIFIHVADNSILEGNAGTTRTLSLPVIESGAGAGTQQVSFHYQTDIIVGSSSNATPNDDYVATSGTIVIPVGSTSAHIDITVNGDNNPEQDEVIKVTLGQPSSDLTLLEGFARGFIDNDDQVPNLGPTANYDLGITAPNTPITMDVLSNDTDPENDSLSISQVFSATNGTASVVGGGHQIQFTPSTDFTGVASFGYVVDDGHGNQRNGFDQVLVGGDGSPGVTKTQDGTITGTGGNDTLTGGQGDDTIVGSPGDDRIDGGAGFNFLDLRQAAHGANMQFRDAWIWDDGDGGKDILTNIQGVYGTPIDDIIDGSSANAQAIATGYRFYGGDGNDKLTSDAGDDILDGGAGDDQLWYGAGHDTVFGGAGNDNINYFTGASDTVGDYLDGGSGNDNISSNPNSADTMIGGPGNDYLQFGNGDTVSGGSGNDTFYIGSAGHNPSYHATITDLAPGDKIEWTPQTPVIVNLTAVWFVGPITNGTGATTGLDHVEFSTSATESTLYFGLDSTPGADFTLSLPNTITLSQLQVDTSSLPLIIHILGPLPSGPTGINLSNTTVSENSSNGTLVGLLSATEPGNTTNFTYTLLDDAGGRFSLDGTNLVVAGALDYEAAKSYDVKVEVADADGLTLDKTFSIGLLDVNEGPPAITSNGGGSSASISIAENSTSTVTTVHASDPDTGASLIYSISGGADESRFQINASTGVLSFRQTPDFEAPSDVDETNVFDVQVQVTDGTYSDLQSLAVTVTNVIGATITGTVGNDTINATKTVLGQPLPTGEEDVINGGSGNDIIDGLAGNDTISGGPGADSLTGGAGIDTLSYTDSPSGLVVVLSPTGGAKVSGGDGTGDKVISGFENISGSTHNDTLTGNALSNVLVGGAGDDLVTGLGGFDRLDGGDGNDTVSYAGSILGVTVDLSQQGSGDALTGTAGTIQHGGDAEGDLLWNFENIVGSKNADTLTGDGNNNIVDGGGGNDTLDGGDGDDVLVLSGTGNQNDVIDGGNGSDTIKTSGAVTLNGFDAGADSIEAWLCTATKGAGVTGTSASETFDLSHLASVTNLLFVDGGTGNDVLTGSNAWNGDLRGGVGNDTLHGGTGDDKLTGGTGTDTFVFNVGGGHDTIADFTTSKSNPALDDQITLSGFGTDYMSDIHAHMTQSGKNVIIDFHGDGTDTLTILKTTIAALDAHQADFHLV